jgi:DNA transformation protein and related proteins
MAGTSPAITAPGKCFSTTGMRLVDECQSKRFTLEREVAVLDTDSIRELFSPFRDVAAKRMFGGIGLYADGLMFGLVFDGVIYLRVDTASIPDFEREGSAPFVYPLMKSRPGRASQHFWRLPDRLYDEPDELAIWAGRALAIAESRKSAPRGRTQKPPAQKKAPLKNKPPAKKRRSSTYR